MIGNQEAQRIQALGADPARITVSGSAKLDGLYLRLKEEDGAHRFENLNLGNRDLVWVAGSTRTGEEEILLEAYGHLIRSYPGLVLILVPRHLNRIRAIMRILAARGLKFELFSEIASAKASRSHPIVLVDRMGELFSLYRLADIVFCGASLVPKGGQNPLEPAAWGKVVLYGPHMEDFQEATGLLTNLGVGFIVEDGKELVTIMEKFLSDPIALKEMGKRGRELFQFKGAAMAHAKIIYEKLPKEITE
jgi:3-deoxy-D-manno-octulosonic-acid transferase